ncbi:GTP binding protein [Verticillium dahliae]|nr:GTP binding protein [Verticillium dahliae]
MENLHQNVIPQAVDELVTPGDHQQHTTAAANILTASEIDSLLQNWTHDNTGQLVRNQAGGDAALLPDPDRLRRTRALGDVLHTVQQLWYAGSEEIDAVAQILANGSRTASWRLPLGDSAVFDFFLGILAVDTIRQSLKLQILRLAGNCCADADENRARVVSSNHMPALLAQLEDDSLLPFAIQVIHNVMMDYESTQLAALNAGLSAKLVDLLASPRFAHCQHLLGMIGTIFEMLVGHQSEATVANPQTPLILLNLALSPAVVDDAADVIQLTLVALSYLSFENLQTVFVSSYGMPSLLGAYYHISAKLDPTVVAEEDLEAQLKQLRNTFMQLLADLCYLPTFNQVYDLSSPIFQTFQSWLSSPGNPSLQAAACLCLGNVARSDEASLALVSNHQLHTPVIAITAAQVSLATAQPAQGPFDAVLLHSALSLLKNLAIPASSRPVLGDLLTPDLLPTIWSLDPNTSMQTPQLHFAAVSLTRLLLTSTPQNVRRLCAPLSPDPLSPLSSQTLLHRLLDVFARADPTQAAHTRTEAARAALAVVRVLHTTPVPPLLPDWDPRDDGYDVARPRREVFYRRHGALGKALAHLVVQPKFGVLRSEAWFVFALMARSEDGAGVVSKVLAVPGAWEALVESITGRREGEERSAETAEERGEVTISTDAASVVDGLQPQQVDPQQAEGMARVDRENGLVLVSELVKHAGGDFPAARRAALGEMLKEGGELVAEGRKDDGAKEG